MSLSQSGVRGKMFENNREWNERDAQRIFAQSTTSLWIIAKLSSETVLVKRMGLDARNYMQIKIYLME